MAKRQTESIRELAKQFKKAAEAAEAMADIAENEELLDEQQEEQMEEATAKFLAVMIRIQKIQNEL